MNVIKILLVDDHCIVREGLRSLLQMEPDFEIIADAGNGCLAVEMTRLCAPDVVVMDIAMPLLNGMEATRQILRERPETKILILSAHGDDSYVEQSMSLGASGYLIKQTASYLLPKAIRRAYAGQRSFSPVISTRFHHHARRALAAGETSKGKQIILLTTREMEVLQLIAEGKANKQTAGVLSISVKTVEKHRQNVMEKLNIHDTAGLTRYAIATGVIESSIHTTTSPKAHESNHHSHR